MVHSVINIQVMPTFLCEEQKTVPWSSPNTGLFEGWPGPRWVPFSLLNLWLARVILVQTSKGAGGERNLTLSKRR